MTECNCLSSKYRFTVYKKNKKVKWYHHLNLLYVEWPVEEKIVVIHGETISDIEAKRDVIKMELENKFDNGNYKVYASQMAL